MRHITASTADGPTMLSCDRPAHGQIVYVYFSERRNPDDAARSFFVRAIAGIGSTPERIVTERARCYPPALRAVLLRSVEHRCSRYVINALECDYGHLKQRLRPMRGFKDPASAEVVVRGYHALVQNLRNGFSRLTAPVEHRLRLLSAWSQLERSI
jgi:putative transposase